MAAPAPRRVGDLGGAHPRGGGGGGGAGAATAPGTASGFRGEAPGVAEPDGDCGTSGAVTTTVGEQVTWPPILARLRAVTAACRRPHNRNPAEPSSDSGPVFTAHLDRIANRDDEGAEDGASQSRFCALCGLDRVGHVSGGAECRRRQGLPPNGPVPPWIAGQSAAGLAAPRSGGGTADGGRQLRGAPVTFLCPSCGRNVQWQWTLWCSGCHRCRACCDCDPPEDRPPMPIKIRRWWVTQRQRKIRRLNSRLGEE